MFDYDWFYGTSFLHQQEEARLRCTLVHFPALEPETMLEHADANAFFEAVEVRRLIYLRDGFSYEIRELANIPSKSHLVFECEPVDDHYKVGAFVVSVPFEEIVRVEVFAVHPSEKPEDSPLITGFRSRPERTDGEAVAAQETA